MGSPKQQHKDRQGAEPAPQLCGGQGPQDTAWSTKGKGHQEQGHKGGGVYGKRGRMENEKRSWGWGWDPGQREGPKRRIEIKKGEQQRTREEEEEEKGKEREQARMEGRPRDGQTREGPAGTNGGGSSNPKLPPWPLHGPRPAQALPAPRGGHLSVSALSSVLSGGARGSRLVGPCGSVFPSSWGVSTPVGRGGTELVGKPLIR